MENLVYLCSKCGLPMEASQKFCASCGGKIKSQTNDTSAFLQQPQYQKSHANISNFNSRQKWEYQRIYLVQKNSLFDQDRTNKILYEWGQQGWELISTAPQIQWYYLIFPFCTRTKGVYFYFRRLVV